MTTLHKAAREALEALEAGDSALNYYANNLTSDYPTGVSPYAAPIVKAEELIPSALATLRAALSEAPGDEREAAWFSLVMNAAAELEDAANCLRDTDAERKARNASKHYRDTANIIYATRAMLAARHSAPTVALTLEQVRALPMTRAPEIDGEEADGTPIYWRDRPYVSLRKLEELLRAHGITEGKEGGA